jgi:hypothetical protein
MFDECLLIQVSYKRKMYATAVNGHTFLYGSFYVESLHTVLGQEFYAHDLQLLPGEILIRKLVKGHLK